MRLPVKVHQWQSPKPTVPAKAGPINLVLHSPLSARENPSTDLGYPVNMANDDKGQGDLFRTMKLVQSTQNPESRTFSSEATGECSKFRFLETVQSGGSFALYQDKETCSGSNSKNGISKYEVHEPSVHDKDLPFSAKGSWETQKHTERSQWQHLKTNVLTWGMFMASSMKAAIHLGPNYLANLEVYKNTNFEGNSETFFFNSHTKIDIGAF